MKLKLAILSALSLALAATEVLSDAQDSHGLFHSLPPEPAKPQPGIPLREPDKRPPIYRVVDGQLYDAARSKLWHVFSGVCEGGSTNGLIIGRGVGLSGDSGPRNDDQLTIIKNFVGLNGSRVALSEAAISFWAMNVGTTNIQGRIMAVLDCGTPYSGALTGSPAPSTNRQQQNSPSKAKQTQQ